MNTNHFKPCNHCGRREIPGKGKTISFRTFHPDILFGKALETQIHFIGQMRELVEEMNATIVVDMKKEE